MGALPERRHSTIAAIDEAVEARRELPRPHLGCSMLGHPCDRYIWLSFRWAVRENFCGRMLRLFDRGHREEKIFVDLLRAAGVVIHHTDADPEGQTHLDFGCHVGGSVDGIIESGLAEAPKTRHIAELKTSSDRAFKDLKKNGVFMAKRMHWCQMQLYMLGTKIDRAFYLVVNKDTDELYSERVDYNPDAAQALLERGKRLALAERLPPRLNDNPAWWQCKMCPCHEFCHVTHCIKPDAVSCRTCAHVTPMPGGYWDCNIVHKELLYSYEKTLPDDGRERCEKSDAVPNFKMMDVADQLEACPNHVLHPDLVPWPLVGGCDDDGKPGDKNGIFMIDGKQIVNGAGMLSAEILRGLREPESGVPF